MTVMRTIAYEITEDHILDILKVLNRFEDDPITLEEVKGNKGLMDYICKEIEDDRPISLYDPFELWNADGWHSVQNYRVK